MWLAVLKLSLFIYLTTVTSAQAFHYHGDLRHKTDYVTSKWRERLREHNGNRLQSVATTEKPEPIRMRHSRFPNLDRVLNKLDDMQERNTRRPLFVAPRYTTTTTTTDDGLVDEYDDEDLNYDDDDLEDDTFDKDDDDEMANDGMVNDQRDVKYDDNTDYEDDDPDLEENYDDEDEKTAVQAVDATPAPVTSSLTQFKWRHYGTRSRVEESRRNQLMLNNNNDFDAVRAVIQHTVRMNNEGRCARPSPKVIPVQHEHPDPSKKYIPHCTILHRCGEDTGCCSTYATRCGPKKQSIVHLYFYTSTLGLPGSKVERLPFYNHTECACLEISKISEITNATAENLRRLKSGISVRSAGTMDYPAPENIRRCKCPDQYTPRLKMDMSCHCECSESNHVCQRMKKGKEHFSLIDRMCIFRKECSVPSCEYGPYMRQTGRCPRKQERLQAHERNRK